MDGCLLHGLIPSQSFHQGSWVTNKPPKRYTPRTQQLFLRVLNRKDAAEVLRDLPAANDRDENLLTELDISDKQWTVMTDSLGLTKGWGWRDSSMVKGTYCSYRKLGTVPQHPHGGS